MKIAICDDEPIEQARIVALLDTFCQEQKANFTYKLFSGAAELLAGLQTENFQLLFLDIIMPGMNGMETARNIRTFDEQIKLVFFTSSPEFALESYSVGAYHYLVKPVTREKLFPVMQKLVAQMEREEECLAIKTKAGAVRILFCKLSHVEIQGKNLFFHMCDGTVHETMAPLAVYEEAILSRPEFLRVHRSFLVNLRQMQEIRMHDFVTPAGKTVPISRRLYSQVRDDFFKDLFLQREMV